MERRPVTLSASFGSGEPAEEILPLRFTQGFGSLRSELALERSEGMTVMTPLQSAHGRHYLQMSNAAEAA